MSRSDSSALKVGRSADPYVRSRSMQSTHCFYVNVEAIYPDKGHYEKLVHKALEPYQAPGPSREWFTLALPEVIRTIAKVFEQHANFKSKYLEQEEQIERIKRRRIEQHDEAKRMAIYKDHIAEFKQEYLRTTSEPDATVPNAGELSNTFARVCEVPPKVATMVLAWYGFTIGRLACYVTCENGGARFQKRVHKRCYQVQTDSGPMWCCLREPTTES